jgi:cell division protein FtsZ
MMGTGEGYGDNRAIEAAEQAIANPLLDGVSMKGAKGVIISITGGEDMRLMEVDEAANHIKELVDPDANIIWGSAFNNELDGKIRVSVVATGIGAEEIMPMPQPAKVFAFPAARAAEPPRTEVAPEPEMASITLIPPERAAEEMPAMQADEEPEAMTAVAEELDEDEGDELLLDSVDMTADDLEPESGPVAIEDVPIGNGNRSWLTREEAPAAPQAQPMREGGTLFERMSNIARGAAKAQVEDGADEEGPRMRTGTRDPLDIPRFLNRQNNQ